MSNAVIIGPRRAGKSTLALAFAGTKSSTIVIWDPNGQYCLPGLQTVSPSAIGQWVEETSQDEQSDMAICRMGPFEDDEEIEEQFGVMAGQLSQHRGYALIIDEASMLQSPQRMHRSLQRFLRRSTADTWIIQTSHRAYELGQLTRQLCDDMIVFRTDSKRERDYLDENYLQGMGERASNVKDREFVHWYRRNAGSVYCVERYNANAWYIDLANANARLDESTTTLGRLRKGA